MTYNEFVKKVPKKHFIDVVNTCTSFRQILEKCGLGFWGAHFKIVKERIRNLGLDTSKLKGQGWNKGNTNLEWAYTEISKHLKDNTKSGKSSITSFRLKNRLIKAKILEAICSNCKNTEWLGNLIPLELEHKDGNKYNNLLENLCLLCPNCHALTDTYRAKNYGRYKS